MTFFKKREVKTPLNCWKTAILSGGIAFQVFFAVELFLLYGFIVINPAYHLISYENWMWILNEWTPPPYRELYFNEILLADLVVNWIFKLFFGVVLIHILIHPERVSLGRRTIALTFFLLVAAHLCIRYHLKHHIDFYRLYMRSIYTEMLALYMIYCGKRYRLPE